MKLITATATALLIATGAQAEIDASDRKAIVERFIACYEGKVTGVPDAERLACYEAMALDMAKLIASGDPVKGTSCKITAFNMQPSRTDMRIMSGESSCRDGRFSYRLTRNGKFITAGSAYVRGYVFEDVVTFPGTDKGIQMSYDFE